jgi:hypothetical protein
LNFRRDYLDYLETFHFAADVFSMKEGEVVFPLEPVIRVEGKLLEAQLIETLLLNLINYQSLIATKASRMRLAAGSRVLSDFGLRRAPAQGGIIASRAAIIGGFDSTSNVEAARMFNLEPAGTMAHSLIESHGDEFQAFINLLRPIPDGPLFWSILMTRCVAACPTPLKLPESSKIAALSFRAFASTAATWLTSPKRPGRCSMRPDSRRSKLWPPICWMSWLSEVLSSRKLRLIFLGLGPDWSLAHLTLLLMGFTSCQCLTAAPDEAVR